MSLPEAISEIADMIESDWQETVERGLPFTPESVLSYVRLLRMAVKAQSTGPLANPVVMSLPSFPTAESQHVAMIEMERRKLRELRDKAGGDAVLTELADGPSAGDMILVDPLMSVGAKTEILNNIYVKKEDGKLWLCKSVE